MDSLENFLKKKLGNHQMKDGLPSWESLEKDLFPPVYPTKPKREWHSFYRSSYVRAAAVFLALWFGVRIFQPGKNSENGSEKILHEMASQPEILQWEDLDPASAQKNFVLSSGEGQIQASRGISEVASMKWTDLERNPDFYGFSLDKPMDLSQEAFVLIPSTPEMTVDPSEIPTPEIIEQDPDLHESRGIGLSKTGAPFYASVFLFSGQGGRENPGGSFPSYAGVSQNTLLKEFNHASQDRAVNYGTLRHRIPLIFGLTFRKPIFSELWLESGLVYQYLRSESDMSGSMNAYRYRQHLHYLGIPVNLAADLFKTNSLRLYVSGGIMGEMALSAKGSMELSSFASGEMDPSRTFHNETVYLNAKGVVWSLKGTAGLEVQLAPKTGIYLEPGWMYYPKHHHQPMSYRTENQWIFNMRLGIRKEF